jgi:hypothetical protein
MLQLYYNSGADAGPRPRPYLSFHARDRAGTLSIPGTSRRSDHAEHTGGAMADHEGNEDRDEPLQGDDESGDRGPGSEAPPPETAGPDATAHAGGPDAAEVAGDDADAGSTARQALYAALAALVVALAALAVAWVSGATDRVEARSVAVVDDEGRTRAVLGADDQGRVSLRLLEPSGRAAATLEAGDVSPELNLQGAEGQVRLGLGDVIQNGGGLSFYDAADQLRVGLAFSPGVGSNMVLGDQDGNAGVQVALDGQGPFVTLRAPDGSVVWAVPEPSAEDDEGESQ